MTWCSLSAKCLLDTLPLREYSWIVTVHEFCRKLRHVHVEMPSSSIRCQLLSSWCPTATMASCCTSKSVCPSRWVVLLMPQRDGNNVKFIQFAPLSISMICEVDIYDEPIVSEFIRGMGLFEPRVERKMMLWGRNAIVDTYVSWHIARSLQETVDKEVVAKVFPCATPLLNLCRHQSPVWYTSRGCVRVIHTQLLMKQHTYFTMMYLFLIT